MNTKQIAGIVVFVLVFGVASNSLANHAFADSMKSNVGKIKIQQNIAYDTPESKSDKADTVKSTSTNPIKTDSKTVKTDSKTIKNTNQIKTVKTDSKTIKHTSQIKPKHVVKTTNHSTTTPQKITATSQKTSTTSTVSKDTKVTTDKPESKRDTVDIVKGTK